MRRTTSAAVIAAVLIGAAGTAGCQAGGGIGPGPAKTAAAPVVRHYYVEIGGTAGAAPAPACTHTYEYANQDLRGGIAVPVCYPASAGPWIGGQGGFDAGAPSYDESVRQGVANLLAAVRRAYRADPHGRFTIVGYSQGAQAADEVLQQIAAGTAGVPRGQVDGLLYADPMQPGTGIGALVPRGTSGGGFTSPGAGPSEFAGIPVQRFCIRTDAICDADSVRAIAGLFDDHGNYWQRGDIMTRTIGHDGGDGTVWYPAGS